MVTAPLADGSFVLFSAIALMYHMKSARSSSLGGGAFAGSKSAFETSSNFALPFAILAMISF